MKDISLYVLCIVLQGPDSYYGTKGLRKVTHESLASGKVTFQFTYAAGNNNGTSVEDGQIPEIIFYTWHKAAQVKGSKRVKGQKLGKSQKD